MSRRRTLINRDTESYIRAGPVGFATPARGRAVLRARIMGSVGLASPTPPSEARRLHAALRGCMVHGVGQGSVSTCIRAITDGLQAMSC